VLEQPSEAWFDVDMMQKDMNLALELGRAVDVPLRRQRSRTRSSPQRGDGLSPQGLRRPLDVLAAMSGIGRGRVEMSASAERSAAVRTTTERWLAMYRDMATIRFFEEQVNELYRGAKMPGLAHLYTGEEAVASGSARPPPRRLHHEHASPATAIASRKGRPSR